jgi:hypothetical protein
MPQPALAILSQESVHTTLSITHHTRKQPPTGPRTTHGPQLVYIFARIDFLCNQDLNEQSKGKTDISPFAT